jgi:hypothetical protein
MQGRTTAAQPVLSQRVERQPVSRAGYFTNLVAWTRARIMRQEWTPVDATCEAAAQRDAFEAVRHENRVLNQPSVSRDEDSTVIAANLRGSTAERYHGPHGRLLTFKRPK